MYMTDKNFGYSDVLIGLQYGDEGKARVIDLIAKNYDIVARFNGGANAGHSLEFGDLKIALNQVPSAIFYPEKQMWIGSGCVVDVILLSKEIANIQKLGINTVSRLRISSQASVVQFHHILIDTISGGSIGTTKKGIGPAYSDKTSRMWNDRLLNIRLADFCYDFENTMAKMKLNWQETKILHNYEGENPDWQEFEIAWKEVCNYVELDTLWLQKQVESGKKLLFEGAQATMLDVTKGTTPFVTSSSTLVSGCYDDINIRFHRKTIGVAKVIMSRVGFGPFASEFGGRESENYCMSGLYTKEQEKLLDLKKMLKSDNLMDLGIALRAKTGEYGVVSKRTRRVGAFDLVQLNYAIKINGVDELVLTKCDLLDIFENTCFGAIPVVTKYFLNKKEIDYIPANVEACYQIETQNTLFSCFINSLENISNRSDLPTELKNLLDFVEKFVSVKIVGIGVGPERDQFINFKLKEKMGE